MPHSQALHDSCGRDTASQSARKAASSRVDPSSRVRCSFRSFMCRPGTHPESLPRETRFAALPSLGRGAHFR
eukprot:3915894-Prymnesium_polylepis.2